MFNAYEKARSSLSTNISLQTPSFLQTRKSLEGMRTILIIIIITSISPKFLKTKSRVSFEQKG